MGDYRCKVSNKPSMRVTGILAARRWPIFLQCDNKLQKTPHCCAVQLTAFTVYAKAKEGKPVEEAKCAPIIRNTSKYGKPGAEVNAAKR